MSRESQVTEYGWTAAPLDPQKWASMGTQNPPIAYRVQDNALPDTPLVQKATEYVKQHLPVQTVNHSMRVYHYGRAIARQYFPEWKFSDETWLLTCLFHDIGTMDRVIREMFMSFDLYGGWIALDVLRQNGAPAAQAESVAEAVIRHQHPSQVGRIHAVGLLIQFTTLFGSLSSPVAPVVVVNLACVFVATVWRVSVNELADNLGAHKEFVHEDTVKDVTKHYPRKEWSSCFATTLREEITLKPWCHSTVCGDDFPDNVEHNEVMEPYDKLH